MVIRRATKTGMKMIFKRTMSQRIARAPAIVRRRYALHDPTRLRGRGTRWFSLVAILEGYHHRCLVTRFAAQQSTVPSDRFPNGGDNLVPEELELTQQLSGRWPEKKRVHPDVEHKTRQGLDPQRGCPEMPGASFTPMLPMTL